MVSFWHFLLLRIRGQVQDLMKVDKALFNLHMKNDFTATLQPKS
jgi:hypothetical protein